MSLKLAKMNLLLNNVRGDVREANSFYADPHNAVGRFDYVMANSASDAGNSEYDIRKKMIEAGIIMWYVAVGCAEGSKHKVHRQRCRRSRGSQESKAALLRLIFFGG